MNRSRGLRWASRERSAQSAVRVARLLAAVAWPPLVRVNVVALNDPTEALRLTRQAMAFVSTASAAANVPLQPRSVAVDQGDASPIECVAPASVSHDLSGPPVRTS